MSEGIDFSCSITTNRVLLTEQTIHRIADLNFSSFQITLDGDKKRHNSVRYNSQVTDSHSLILSNVVNLVRLIPDTQVILRINYDDRNLTEQLFYDVDTILHAVKERITIILKKVWQVHETPKMGEDAIIIMSLFIKSGYRVDHDYDDFSLISCYVEQKHYNSIYPNGFVDQCNNKDMYSARGYLEENGMIKWRDFPQEDIIDLFSVDNECYRCRYLPLCMGPCPKRREKLTSSKEPRCMYRDRDKQFEEEILGYCELKQIEACL